MKKVLILISFIYAFAIELTQQEKDFIQNRKIKCSTTTSWAPFNTKIDGRLEGIAIDYWNLIKSKLKLKTSCTIEENWSDILNNIKEKKIDLTLATSKNEKTKRVGIFSIPYATFPLVIATKNHIGYISSLSQLENKTIVVGKNYSSAILLKKYYPYLHIKEVKNIKKALEMVNKGEAFAAIDLLPVIAWNINKYSFSNLKIAGYTPLNVEIRFLIRKDYQTLQHLINKAILDISEEEKLKIASKWTIVKPQKAEFPYWIIGVFSLIILILILFIIKLYKEIKKEKAKEKELENLSNIDTLTNTFNRHKLDETLKKEIKKAKKEQTPLSVIFFDIDHFKHINDTYGHQTGDKVLEELARVVSSHIRKTDILGRYGGEEFVIILPNTNLENAYYVAQKIKLAVENTQFAEIPEKITCSFGVTSLRKDDTIESLIKRADKLMYEAKRRGRNAIVSDLECTKH